jgi:hypothetical protein
MESGAFPTASGSGTFPPMRVLFILAAAALSLSVGCGSTITVFEDDGGGVGDPDDTPKIPGKDDDPKTSGSGSSGAGSGSGSSGSGSSGSGGGLSPPTEACWECAELKEESGQCEFELDQCFDNLACNTLFSCYDECEYGGDCVLECNEIVPSGVDAMSALLSCIACDNCQMECAGSAFTQFCP